MHEGQRPPTDEELDAAAYELGLKLDWMLVRLGRWMPTNTEPRRAELEERFGPIPEPDELTERSLAAADMEAFRRVGRLPFVVRNTEGAERPLLRGLRRRFRGVRRPRPD